MREGRGRALAVAVLLIGLTGCAGSGTGEPQASTPASSTMPPGTAPIEPGTYRIPKSAWSVADFSVTFPEGWTVQYGHTYLKHSDADDELSFYAVVVDDVYTDACKGADDFTGVGPTVLDLATALLRQPGPKVDGPYPDTLGDLPAIRLDLYIPKNLDLKACNLEGIGLQIWYSPPADKHFVLLRDGIASVYILDVDGQRQVFLTQHRSATSRKDIGELQAALTSIRIET